MNQNPRQCDSQRNFNAIGTTHKEDFDGIGFIYELEFEYGGFWALTVREYPQYQRTLIYNI